MNDHQIKVESIRLCGKSMRFLQQLKRHAQVGETHFSRARAAYGLTLIDEYLNGQFLQQVQEYREDDGYGGDIPQCDLIW